MRIHTYQFTSYIKVMHTKKQSIYKIVLIKFQFKIDLNDFCLTLINVRIFKNIAITHVKINPHANLINVLKRIYDMIY